MKNNLINEKTGVFYLRYSSSMQREESIEAQRRACEGYAQKHGIRIVGEYVDRAQSATSDKRPEFQRMIADSDNGDFKYVIVHKLDRFARDRQDSMVYRVKLKRNNVTLLSVTENYDPNSPEGILMEAVLEGINEFYSANLAREVEKGKRENALKGLHVGGIPPLGYNVDTVTQKLVINPREAESVSLIFQWYLDGKSYGEIVRDLDALGYRSKLGNNFRTNSLHDILKNPKYKGLYVYSRTSAKSVDGTHNRHKYKADEDIVKVEGGCPAIVSVTDFERVQERMYSRKRKAASYRAKREYLLSGKIVCGQCGKAYVGNCRKANDTHPEYLSYRCNNRTKQPRCSGWEISKELLESILLNELSNVVFDDALIPLLKNGYSQYLASQNGEGLSMQQSLKKEIADIKKQMDNIMRVIANNASDALVDKLNELDSHKKGHEQRLQELQSKHNVVEISEAELAHSFKQAREMLKNGSLSSVKALIERYIKQITIDGEKIEIQFSLNVNSRVNYYSADRLRIKRKIPQTTRQDDSAIFFSQPWLAAYGLTQQNRCHAVF